MKHILKIPPGNLADEASWGSGSVEINASSYGLQGEIIVVVVMMVVILVIIMMRLLILNFDDISQHQEHQGNMGTKLPQDWTDVTNG